MQEFLVEITVTVPAGTPAIEFDQRRAAEFARARELADRGLLRRMWRPVGAPGIVSLWRTADRTELDDEMRALPLFPWMTVKITELEPHPNGPNASGG